MGQSSFAKPCFRVEIFKSFYNSWITKIPQVLKIRFFSSAFLPPCECWNSFPNKASKLLNSVYFLQLTSFRDLLSFFVLVLLSQRIPSFFSCFRTFKSDIYEAICPMPSGLIGPTLEGTRLYATYYLMFCVCFLNTCPSSPSWEGLLLLPAALSYLPVIHYLCPPNVSLHP